MQIKVRSYTRIRRFYAWVGFMTIVFLTIALATLMMAVAAF